MVQQPLDGDRPHARTERGQVWHIGQRLIRDQPLDRILVNGLVQTQEGPGRAGGYSMAGQARVGEIDFRRLDEPFAKIVVEGRDQDDLGGDSCLRNLKWHFRKLKDSDRGSFSDLAGL